MTGATEFLYKTHNSKDFNKKDKYEKLLGGRAESRQKTANYFLHADENLLHEFKPMVKESKKIEGAWQSKRIRRKGNDSKSYSLLEQGF